MSDFSGRVAFITGGARGQGRAHAVAFAHAGADVVVCDRCADVDTVDYPLATSDDLATTAKLVEAEGRKCLALEADVRDVEALEGVISDARAAFGRVDILSANAGVAIATAIQDHSSAQWDDAIGINLTGVFNAIRAVAPTMIEQRYGRIIATSSMMGRGGAGGIPGYVASKWGVIGLVKSVAHDLAPFGVTVNAIAPGNIKTPMVLNEAMYNTLRPAIENPGPDDLAKFMRRLHVQNVPWMEPEEVSRIVLFLADEASAHITGSVVPIDAGASARVTA
jgi:SDR family mycofactocin-dependent oxidoreductase